MRRPVVQVPGQLRLWSDWQQWLLFSGIWDDLEAIAAYVSSNPGARVYLRLNDAEK